MARVDLPVGRISRLVAIPLPAAASDATNDHDMVNNGVTLVLVVNTGGSTRNGEAVIQQTIDGQTPTVVPYSIPAGGYVVLGPFPPEIYGDHLLFNIDNNDLDLRAFSLL